ncbi:hypothetical protein GH721_18030 [Kriegella sp. EG-1]|nr:hypothetical protein [Flavobacteriaceae bacterium EG-1]
MDNFQKFPVHHGDVLSCIENYLTKSSGQNMFLYVFVQLNLIPKYLLFRPNRFFHRILLRPLFIYNQTYNPTTSSTI